MRHRKPPYPLATRPILTKGALTTGVESTDSETADPQTEPSIRASSSKSAGYIDFFDFRIVGVDTIQHLLAVRGDGKK